MSEIPEVAPVDVPDGPKPPSVVTPEILLAQIVSHIGEEFVVIPTDGWMKIVKAIQDFDKSENLDENLLETLEGLGIPVVPVSLAKKDEASKIIMPNDTPDGDSKIIMPNDVGTYPEGGIIKP